jgi:hypothetical protein
MTTTGQLAAPTTAGETLAALVEMCRVRRATDERITLLSLWHIAQLVPATIGAWEEASYMVVTRLYVTDSDQGDWLWEDGVGDDKGLRLDSGDWIEMADPEWAGEFDEDDLMSSLSSLDNVTAHVWSAFEVTNGGFRWLDLPRIRAEVPALLASS